MTARRNYGVMPITDANRAAFANVEPMPNPLWRLRLMQAHREASKAGFKHFAAALGAMMREADARPANSICQGNVNE